MTKLDLTAGGRLEVSPFVNQKKIEAMSHLIAVSQSGGFAAEKARVQLKETLSTSDAIFSLAHLVNIRNLPEYDAAPRQWTKIAAVETVDDFTPTSFQRLVPNFDNLKFGKGNKGKPGVSPVVAELDTYQYAYGYAEESVKFAIEKRGFKWGVSLERIINNASREIRQIPGDMLNVALDTDEFLVFDALQSNVVSSSELLAGTDTATGTAVVADAPFSASAARVLFSQIASRQDTLTKRKVGLANSYYVVVALGQAEFVQAQLDLYANIATITDGSIVFGKPSVGNLSKITGVIESEWITSDTAWYLVPAAGTTRRPSLVKLQLAGRTAPEVLVNNFTGQPIGANNGSDPFTLAHFDNDSVDLKLRQFTNSALITQQQLGWSSGDPS
jgi:hypothetical protein